MPGHKLIKPGWHSEKVIDLCPQPVPLADLYLAGDSDLLTVYNAYCSWCRTCNTSGASEQQFCRKNYLSQPNLMNIEELKAQLAIALVDAGFLELREDEGISLNKYIPKSPS